MTRLDYNGMIIFVWHEGGQIQGIEDAYTTDIMQEFHRDELLIIEKMIEDENI